jgi:hypothetical protein
MVCAQTRDGGFPMGNGFDVEHTALRTYASQIQQQVQRMAEVHATYTEHANAEVTNSSEAAGLLPEIGTALTGNADAYIETDTALAALHHDIIGELGGA